jgi:sterol desaturase/sphingolipid hydroxylase (fatty acid hydroxylase superfamily)
VIDTVLTRIIAPTGAVGFALFAGARGWGLFNLVELPAWLTLVLALVVLDLAIYLQHRLFHYVPVLWRMHRMHHSDIDVDVTTGREWRTAGSGYPRRTE